MPAPHVEVNWVFSCDYALLDQAGKLSIIGIFDRLYASNFPSLHPSLYLVAGWTGPPGQLLHTEIRIWSPAKELVASVQQQIAFGPDGRSTAVAQVSPLPLSGLGEHIFEFLAGGESLFHYTIQVEQPPQA